MTRTNQYKNQAFTLIELMIVIAIVGILAAIAIPNFISYRQRAYNSSANSDAKNCYFSAQAYFIDNDAGSVDLAQVKSFGFLQTKDVIVTCTGVMSALEITTTHPLGTKVYSIDSNGQITES